eukprot:TRINITY_DN18938_c0_g1_i1.p1 TRINITY_DN18938_c0_g1~~TRINITY_DN18938_c0_g1_i1.p1  ORF type:complete len:291 (+),score=112.51 TRINITY_DN18938_c0_g1_i1:88-960(+)
MSSKEAKHQEKLKRQQDKAAWLKEGPADRTIDVTGVAGDRISPREFEALQELKKNPVAEGHDDKYLMAFLFGRKLDIARTIEMLTANIKWRNENGYQDSSTAVPCERIYNTNYSYVIPGTRDRQGRAIEYIMAGRLKMKEFTLKELIDWAVAFWEYTLRTETLEVFRDGIIVIESIHGVSMSSYDMKNGKALMSAFQDHFPLRIKLIVVVDPPGIVRALMAIARIFLKKKLIERVRLCKTEELAEIVDPEQLSHDFGGKAVWQLPPREVAFPWLAAKTKATEPTEFVGDL